MTDNDDELKAAHDEVDRCRAKLWPYFEKAGLSREPREAEGLFMRLWLSRIIELIDDLPPSVNTHIVHSQRLSLVLGNASYNAVSQKQLKEFGHALSEVFKRNLTGPDSQSSLADFNADYAALVAAFAVCAKKKPHSTRWVREKEEMAGKADAFFLYRKKLRPCFLLAGLLSASAGADIEPEAAENLPLRTNILFTLIQSLPPVNGERYSDINLHDIRSVVGDGKDFRVGAEKLERIGRAIEAVLRKKIEKDYPDKVESTIEEFKEKYKQAVEAFPKHAPLSIDHERFI